MTLFDFAILCLSRSQIAEDLREERKARKIAAKWARRPSTGIYKGKTVEVLKPAQPAPVSPHCVRCGIDVNPTFSNRAKVLQAFSFMMREVTKLHPVTFEDVVIDHKFIPITKFVTGYVCDACGSEYKSIKGVPIVQILPGHEAVPHNEKLGGPPRRGFDRKIHGHSAKHAVSSSRAISLRAENSK